MLPSRHFLDADHADDLVLVLGHPQGALAFIGEISLAKILDVGTGIVLGNVAFEQTGLEQLPHGAMVLIARKTQFDLVEIEVVGNVLGHLIRSSAHW